MSNYVRQSAISTRIDTLLATWLRNEPTGIERLAPDTNYKEILERIDFHGIAGLIYSQPSLLSNLPEAFRLALRDKVINRLFWEKAHSRLLEEMLPFLGDARKPPLLFKGTALAYSCYDVPATRTRGDTDILVADGAFYSAAKALMDQGLVSPMTSGGEVISIERTFTFTDRTGFGHHIDLHRKLSNAIVLAKLFSYDELLGRSISLPDLGPVARAFGKIDALLVACMHRMVHIGSPYYVNDIAYFSADRLIWLYDIHLLAGGFSEQDWDSFLILAQDKGLMEIVGDGLRSTHNALMTDIPTNILNRFARMHPQEAAAKYLCAQPLQRMVMNFKATRGFDRKAQFLRELVFPPASYMRVQFAHLWPAWLPWLYVVRAVLGIWKLVSRKGGRT
jgi:hypothetical protein